MDSISVETMNRVVDITIDDLAKAFWSMDSRQQAHFFDRLGAAIEEDHKTNSSAYSFGELQWCHLKYELRKPGMDRANNVHMALSAFAYDFVDRKLEGCRS